ncbi:hypothetical protein FHS42_001722 [Streptomyces zagrosensis]|uniref:Uncharacterized protein n=1 Tax=Streptomyces zagrosensis TaxID=1042984 RepID=A0A7W9Q6X4_9ACTN|nr:hypothetical protein [Streptomyces zagrosensis]
MRARFRVRGPPTERIHAAPVRRLCRLPTATSPPRSGVNGNRALTPAPCNAVADAYARSCVEKRGCRRGVGHAGPFRVSPQSWGGRPMGLSRTQGTQKTQRTQRTQRTQGTQRAGAPTLNGVRPMAGKGERPMVGNGVRPMAGDGVWPMSSGYQTYVTRVCCHRRAITTTQRERRSARRGPGSAVSAARGGRGARGAQCKGPSGLSCRRGPASPTPRGDLEPRALKVGRGGLPSPSSPPPCSCLPPATANNPQGQSLERGALPQIATCSNMSSIRWSCSREEWRCQDTWCGART